MPAQRLSGHIVGGFSLFAGKDGNGFGRVQNRTAANADDTVRAAALAERNGFVHHLAFGIGHDAHKFAGNAALQQLLDLTVKSHGRDNLIADKQNFLTACKLADGAELAPPGHGFHRTLK